MLYYNDHNEKTSRLVSEGDVAEICDVSNDELAETMNKLSCCESGAGNYLSDGSFEFTYDDKPLYEESIIA